MSSPTTIGTCFVKRRWNWQDAQKVLAANCSIIKIGCRDCCNTTRKKTRDEPATSNNHQITCMSHPMFGLSGTAGSTDAIQKFRSSLRTDLVGADSGKKSMTTRSFRDSDGAYQTSYHANNRLNRTSASVKKPVIDLSAHLIPHHFAPDSANLSQSLHEVGHFYAPVKKHLHSTMFCSHEDFASSLPVITTEWSGAQCSEDVGVWDQRTLDAKLEKLQFLSHQQMQLLSKVTTAIPAAANGSAHSTSSNQDSKCDLMHDNQPSKTLPQQMRPLAYISQLPVLEHIDAVAVQLHRCVTEMRQHIDELTKMQSFTSPLNTTRKIVALSDDAHTKKLDLPRPILESARLHVPECSSSNFSTNLQPSISQPHAAQLHKSPLASRIKSFHPKGTVTAAQQGITLWQGVPELHPCFVAVADGDWSLLLTVQQVKKEDIRSKCVSLSNWNSFLRHSKAYMKLRISQNVSKQAFELALIGKGFTYDECRVNFYGFCQVFFNLATSIGLLGDDNLQSAGGCSFDACAAINRLLLLLVPQFATPGSRTARNHERNARLVSPMRSSKIASMVPRALTCESFSEYSSIASATHTLQHIEEQPVAQTELNFNSVQKLSTARNASDELDDTLPEMIPSLKIRLHIRCNNLLDCDIFSKSDPYAIVFGGVVGERHQDFAEFGRTETIQDNLNPVFKTPVEFVSVGGTQDQELFVQLFDKDDSKDDFLGEASVMLRCLLNDPNHTRTLSLVIPVTCFVEDLAEKHQSDCMSRQPSDQFYRHFDCRNMMQVHGVVVIFEWIIWSSLDGD